MSITKLGAILFDSLIDIVLDHTYHINKRINCL